MKNFIKLSPYCQVKNDILSFKLQKWTLFDGFKLEKWTPRFMVIFKVRHRLCGKGGKVGKTFPCFPQWQRFHKASFEGYSLKPKKEVLDYVPDTQKIYLR